MNLILERDVDADLQRGIQQAIEHNDLDNLALLMTQRQYVPLLRLGQRVRGAQTAQKTLQARTSHLGNLVLEWTHKREAIQRSVHARGENYLRDADFQQAEILVRSLSQWHRLLTEKSGYVGKILYTAEPNLQAALNGEAVLMPPDVMAECETLWQRVKIDLQQYGVTLEPEAENKAA